MIDAIGRLPQGDVKRLQGHPYEWRLRVGDWRVRFRRDDAKRVVYINLIAARGGAYKP
jgi:mRNA-degrading endonuclease RelE of RelBE toxin-antitoxin system